MSKCLTIHSKPFARFQGVLARAISLVYVHIELLIIIEEPPLMTVALPIDPDLQGFEPRLHAIYLRVQC